MLVYVVNQNNQPLMPTKSVIARLLLKDKKAKVIKKVPFTIKLLYDSTGYIQEVVGGIDTGSRFIGSAAIANGKVIYQSEIQIRQDISDKMQQRKMYRRARRNRKTRYRKARWLNRSSMKKDNRLAPSIKSKIDSHLREKKFIESILPIMKWNIEFASFDIHKITNSEVYGIDYQLGQQKDFYNVKAFVLFRDNYSCQKCKCTKAKLHVHHIKFRSQGGTNTPDNLITLCESCHSKLHNNEFTIIAKSSKTKHATEISIIKSQLIKQFEDCNIIYGYETKFKREQNLKLPKEHYYDAVSICCADDEVVDLYNIIYLKRHVSKGDYQQTYGKRSEKKIPTGKLFNFRKFDTIQTVSGVGIIKGKRSSGYFAISDIYGKSIHDSVNVKKNCLRLHARKTTILQIKTQEYALSSVA